jgi:hypothetical protein
MPSPTVPEPWPHGGAPKRFKVVEDWLTARRELWEARLDRFDQYVKQLKEKE